MRMNTPRVAPLDEQELTPEMLDLLGPRFRGMPLIKYIPYAGPRAQGVQAIYGLGGLYFIGRQCVVAS